MTTPLLERPFRRPLGVALAGGGALGAWQAGCLEALSEAGVEFDKIVGFSAGALSGAGYFLGRIPELVSRWRNVDGERILRFKPRLNPWTIFSGDSLWEAVDASRDEARAREVARCELIVVSLDVADDMPVYSRFTPRGEKGWDGPLADRLVASCAIPHIFPPVTIGGKVYVDGGIPGKDWLSFDALSDCRDVLVIEMVRPDEEGRRPWGPMASYEQQGRDLVRRQIESGLAPLRAQAQPPQIFYLRPSKVLDFGMLQFKSSCCAPALELGRADAAAFLRACQTLT